MFGPARRLRPDGPFGARVLGEQLCLLGGLLANWRRPSRLRTGPRRYPDTSELGDASRFAGIRVSCTEATSRHPSCGSPSNKEPRSPEKP